MNDFMKKIQKDAKVAPKGKAVKPSDEIIVDAPTEVQEDIDALIAAKKDMKSAKATITLKEKSILKFGKERRDDMAWKGDFRKSIKIQGTDEDKVVNMVTANKFSLNPDDVKDIHKVIVDAADEDKAAKMLLTNFVVKIKSDVFTDEKRQNELMELLGDRWDDFFETTRVDTVGPEFDRDLYSLGKRAKSKIDLLVKQSKPSLR